MRKTNILIVDDKQENIDALSGLIAADDVEIFTALNAQSALNHLTEQEFGLAMLDVQMPETSGFDLARLLRGVRRYRHLPIIFVTAHQQTHRVLFEGYETGAVDFLFKPLDPHIVRTKVRVFVELNQQRNQLQEHASELQDLRLEAEGANIAKSQFLANMSHEIRTPLAAVMGFADLLSKSEFSQDEKSAFVEAVKRNGDHLLRLIDDILDFSKIEANRLELEHTAFNLGEMLADVETTLSFKAAAHGVTLTVQKPSAPALYMSDPSRVKQILLNVIGNAIKFSKRGQVRAELDIRESQLAHADIVRVRVKDQGVGMTKEQAAQVFQAFSQADPSTRRRFGGSGLGLVISRQIARALNGDVRLIETTPNLGSTFEIELRLPRAVKNETSRLPLNSTEIPKTADMFKGKRVLAVDDSKDNLILIEMYLRSTGANLITVEDGQSAITQVKKNKFDLILMDVQMPGLDGHETTREIRRLGYDKPVIALTAHALVTEREKCRESGCDAILTKPITRSVLLHELTNYLQ